MDIYISYAEADEVHGKRLKHLLKPVEKGFGFTIWSKQDNLPGYEWQQEMAAHMRTAMLFVPMISADFLASDRCQAETRAALRLEQSGRLRIICINMRAAYRELSPLDNMLMLPNREKPIARWQNQDEAWLQVQRGILDAIKEMQLP